MTLTITSRKVIIMKRIDKESIVAAKLLAFGNNVFSVLRMRITS